MNAMPDEPEIDFEKLKADDDGEWERAYPVLYQAGLKVACGYRAQMGEADEDDFIIQAVAEAFAQITKKASFRHLCNFVATATKNAIRDELKRRASVRHGGGKVESLDAMEIGIVDVKVRPSSDDEEPDREHDGGKVQSIDEMQAGNSKASHGSGDAQPRRGVADEKQITPDAAAHLADLAKLFENAFAHVDQRYANVVWDLIVDGLKYEEVAQKRGISICSVGVYKNRGLDALRKQMPDRDSALWWHKLKGTRDGQEIEQTADYYPIAPHRSAVKVEQ
jgi:RNA polymerase sigma factor (sigma-70 family)